MKAARNIGLTVPGSKPLSELKHIKVKGQPDYLDTVAYTNIGPVMYDKSFSGGKKYQRIKIMQ